MVKQLHINMNLLSLRLGLQKMKDIRSSSTMFRITCSFSKYKSDIYRDYLRAELKHLDFLKFKEKDYCCQVDRINIRGHKGNSTTVAFTQKSEIPFHIDSSKSQCSFDAKGNSVVGEDNFGKYKYTNMQFRCTESAESTTEYWLG